MKAHTVSSPKTPAKKAASKAKAPVKKAAPQAKAPAKKAASKAKAPAKKAASNAKAPAKKAASKAKVPAKKAASKAKAPAKTAKGAALPKNPAPAKKTTWELITADEARARLESLPREARDLVKHVLRRDESALWVRGPWTPPRKPPADLARVALIVFEDALATDRSLVLRQDELAGGFAARDEVGLVFLGEVRARDVVSVPGVTAIFTAGVHVDRVAVFDGADGHVQIAKHLHAPFVVSGLGGGGAVLSKGVEVRVHSFVGHIAKLPKGAARAVEELADLLPFMAEKADEDELSPWEVFLDHYVDEPFPRGFVVPPIPR